MIITYLQLMGRPSCSRKAIATVATDSMM